MATTVKNVATPDVKNVTIGDIFKDYGPMFGLKAIRIGMTYLSLLISTNFMSQIYMEKVLINNETPPPLTNFLWLFLFVDIIMNIGYVLVIILLQKFNVFGQDVVIHPTYLMDYGLCMAPIMLFATINASMMYSKKYFLYKDDGLRAIRALSDITFIYAVIFHLIPNTLVFALIKKAFASPGLLADDMIKHANMGKELANKLNPAQPQPSQVIVNPRGSYYGRPE